MDDGGSAGQLAELGELGFCPGKADPEAFDLTVPSFALGLGDAVEQVAADLSDPGPLSRRRPQERAAQAPLTELTTMFQQFMAGFRPLALICPGDRIR